MNFLLFTATAVFKTSVASPQTWWGAILFGVILGPLFFLVDQYYINKGDRTVKMAITNIKIGVWGFPLFFVLLWWLGCAGPGFWWWLVTFYLILGIDRLLLWRFYERR